MIKNIISDIGNVLYEFIVEDFLNDYVDEEDRESFFNNTFNSKDWILMDKGVVSFEDSRKHFIEVCGNKYKDTVNKIFDTSLTVCLNKDNNNIELLKDYHAKGYNIYYLSNMPIETFELLRKETDFFDYVCIGGIISADIKMVKPDKEIFEYFLNKFDVNADECLFIDDNIKNVNSAIEMGIKSVHLKNIDDMYDVLKDETNDTTKLYLVKDFDQVLSLSLLDNKEKEIDENLKVWILEQIEKRNEAKKNKDYETADNIREELKSKGIQIKDTREGTIFEII